MPAERVARWVRGVDASRFTPDLRCRGSSSRAADGRISVLYAGRQTREKGVELLADAFLIAHARDPRLQLVLAGGGPEQGVPARAARRRRRVPRLARGRRARRARTPTPTPSSSRRETDTYGQVVVEAQASGVPVVAVRAGGPADLIAEGRSGLLCEPNPEEIAAKLLRLAESPALRDRLVRGGLAAARERSWEAALAQLAEGYSLALAPAAGRAADPLSRSARRSPPPEQRRLPFTPRVTRPRGLAALQLTGRWRRAPSRLSEVDGGRVVERRRPDASRLDLDDPALYFNREVSWMDFNDRVLQLAEDESIPLLERVKFCAIYEDNLDEFFMVRVAGLHDQVEASLPPGGADGMTAGRAARPRSAS